MRVKHFASRTLEKKGLIAKSWEPIEVWVFFFFNFSMEIFSIKIKYPEKNAENKNKSDN